MTDVPAHVRRFAQITFAIVLAAVAGIAAVSTASAGDPAHQVDITVYLEGITAADDIASASLEFYVGDTPTAVSCTGPTINGYGPTYQHADWACSLFPGIAYTIAVNGVDSYAPVPDSGFCQFNEPSQRIPAEILEIELPINAIDGDCQVTLAKTSVLIDKIVDGGDAATSDFDIEIYGETAPDTWVLVATGNDPSSDLCNADTPSRDDCLIVDLDQGTYQLGEAPSYGYLPSTAGCTGFSGVGERFPDGVGAFTLELQAQAPLFWYCQVANNPYGANLQVIKQIDNTDGGTATVVDFTGEVFTEPGGSLAASGPCTTVDCVDTSLPIGAYRIGESGPAGYATTVECVVEREPNTPAPPTLVTILPPQGQPVEAIPGDDAVVLLEPDGSYTCTITNTATTTTTTSTTSTSTTSTSTTSTSTTSTSTTSTTIAALLPSTGANDSTGPIAIVALLLLVAGSGMLVARRRA
jgi:LPXTG-motif cell wall-anchored protein